MTGDVEWGAELDQKTFRQRRRVGRMVATALHDGEFVAAEAGDRIGFSHDVT